MLLENIKRRSRAVGVLLSNAQSSSSSNTIKSVYYRSSIMLLCTVAEGLVYELVKRSSHEARNLIGSKIEYKERLVIPKSIFGTSHDLCISEKIKTDIHIDNDGVNFGRLNLFLRNHKVVSGSEFELLNWVRKERNRIHLQSLSSADTGYTKEKIEKISKAILFLIPKVMALP